MVSSSVTMSGTRSSEVELSESRETGGKECSLLSLVGVALLSLLLSFKSLSEESLSSQKKFLRVVDLCPAMIIVSFWIRLVFWLGLLNLSLPLGRPEPVLELGGGDKGVEVELADGGGPKRSFAGVLGGGLRSLDLWCQAGVGREVLAA